MIMMITVIVIILAIFFYASIYYPMQEAPEVVDEVNEDYSNIIKDQDQLDDIIIFTFKRNQPHAVQKIALDNNGMNNMNALENNLQSGDYIPVLKALWSEKDIKKKIDWLQEKKHESHPILLFELSVEVVKEDPSLSNLEESLYLLELGKYRTDLDAICVSDSSALAAAQSLYNNYSKVIATVVSQNPSLKEMLTTGQSKEMNVRILQKLLISLKQVQQKLNSLPPPNWVSTHALQMLFSEKQVTISPRACLLKREELIRVFIGQVEAEIKKLKES